MEVVNLLDNGFGVELRSSSMPTPSTLIRAVGDHGIVLIRDLGLSPDDMGRLVGTLGNPIPAPYVEPICGVPNVIRVVREADEPPDRTYARGWHCDLSFLNAPPNISLMYAVETPAHGGSTAFANMNHVFSSLSGRLQDVLRTNRAIHSSSASYGANGYYRAGSPSGMEFDFQSQGDLTAEHDCVIRIGNQDVEALFVNPAYTVQLTGWFADESTPLLAFLYQRLRQEEFCTRLLLAKNDLMVWNNLLFCHRAVPDYSNARREIWRATVIA